MQYLSILLQCLSCRGVKGDNDSHPVKDAQARSPFCTLLHVIGCGSSSEEAPRSTASQRRRDGEWDLSLIALHRASTRCTADTMHALARFGTLLRRLTLSRWRRQPGPEHGLPQFRRALNLRGRRCSVLCIRGWVHAKSTTSAGG